MPWNAKDACRPPGARHPEVRLLGERPRGTRAGRLRLHKRRASNSTAIASLRLGSRPPDARWGMDRPARRVARPRPPRLLRLLHGPADAGLRPEPDQPFALRLKPPS